MHQTQAGLLDESHEIGPQEFCMTADKPKPDFSNVQSGSASTAAAPQPSTEELYTVLAGDSLSKIAKRYYGDANQWQKIFEANRDQIKNPDMIRPGQKLKIPKA
jgi:nucleoid-associated protein YgaU